MMQLASLRELVFDPGFVEKLPADPDTSNRRRQVKQAAFSYVQPTPVSSPSLISVSQELLQQLDLKPEVANSEAFLDLFSGNKMLPGMTPYAMCYGGHQFGHWAGQLGDGRAINLGEVITQNQQRWTLQLKGAGPTPYSRTADGLAVLRSSLREYVCSEAMHFLGVPTTRALSLMTTGEQVVRDMLYDGNPRFEPGAIVCRVAPSFLRFGNFQIFAARDDLQNLQRLVYYCIRYDYADHFGKLPDTLDQSHILEWFEQICQRTAIMIVDWMRVGFVHGVMNTDNMSVLGLTIDYGPYGWVDHYDPEWTPNTTDANGKRYRFSQQPNIALWNLLQLAEAIYPLIKDVKPLEDALQGYHNSFEQLYHDMLAQKLGFEQSDDVTKSLNTELEQLMLSVETDRTLLYRTLAQINPQQIEHPDSLSGVFEPCWYQDQKLNTSYQASLFDWLQRWMKALTSESGSVEQYRQRMNQTNPKYLFRNYLAQQAIDAAEQGDYQVLNELLKVLKKPYDDQPEFDHYAARRPDWARHKPGCSMLSCSS